jgi:hypothetical protein
MLGRRLRLRPVVTAAAAGCGFERVDLGALGAGFGAYRRRRNGRTVAAADLGVDLVHRSVAAAVAGEVQDQTVDLAVALRVPRPTICT